LGNTSELAKLFSIGIPDSPTALLWLHWTNSDQNDDVYLCLEDVKEPGICISASPGDLLKISFLLDGEIFLD
jgi:hypothetical protein